MTKVYIEALDETVTLSEELVSHGIGQYYSLEVEANAEDILSGNVLYAWHEPELDVAIINNESQTVMIGKSFDTKGNLYQIVWTKDEGVSLEDMNGLDEFAEWSNPHSITLIEEER